MNLGEIKFGRVISIVTDKLQSWQEEIISLLPNIVVSVLILILFYFLAKLIRRGVNSLFYRFSTNTAITNLFSTIVYLVVITIGLITALNILHLDQTVKSLLAGAGIIGLALGFAFQNITANLISGIAIAIRKPIIVGDIIETQGYLGEVENINLRVTLLRTFQGLHVFIPNKEIYQNPFINYTKTKKRRIDLDIGISYGDDLDKVEEITKAAVSDFSYLLDDKTPEVYFREFGDSSINLTLMYWVHYPDQAGYLTAVSDGIKSVKKAYDQNDITIPFPIRTLDFGIKGGQKLNETKIKIDPGD